MRLFHQNPLSNPPPEYRGRESNKARAGDLSVIIIGGGLSGMAAAVALESAGAKVTLLESSRRLGGRAASFEDPQSGEELDNCQHVLLGCCTNLLDFYDRLGVKKLIRFDDTIRFADAVGNVSSLSGIQSLPAPLHLGPSLLRFNVLTWPERYALARAMIEMLHMGNAGRLALADVPFGQWLDEQAQPESLIQKLYDPILISALNETARRSSSAYAIQVFQDSLLANAAGYVVGVPDCPLGRLYATVPVSDVRFGARVSQIVFSGSRVTGVELQGGETLNADAVIIATGHHAARRFVPDEIAARDSRFVKMQQLEDVPILGAHLWFDRSVLSVPHLALLDGPLQWLFRKDSDGLSVHGVISAAREWVGRPKEECLRLFEAQVRRTLPAARAAKLMRGVVVVEKRATFSPIAGVDRIRPSQAPPAGGIRNLYLAGDYTLTGWPATMEGAVRGGYFAAEAVHRGATSPSAQRDGERATGAATVDSEIPRFVVPDLSIQWPARLAGLRR